MTDKDLSGEREESADDAEFRRSLLRHYLVNADAKCDRMREILEEARGAGQGRGSLDALGRSLHTLAGNAGTYGFPQLSVRARELSKMVHASAALPGALGSSIEQFIEEMRAAFAQAKAALPPETQEG